MKKLITIISAIIVLVAAYLYLLPYMFISMGRGPISESTLSVVDVRIENTVEGYNGEPIMADIGNSFVTFLIKTSVASTEFDIYEFQLVREKSAEIGMEDNMGNNLGDNYYFWSMKSETDNSSYFSISFQVPSKEKKGYLFYWGVYFGPFVFGS